MDIKPTKLFICCCDNRIIPNNFASEPGDLFVLRNIGNLVPTYGSSDRSVGAALAYAIRHLALPEIIVCGHSDCGGMRAHYSQATQNNQIKDWLTYAVPIGEHASSDELSQANVLHQVEQLKTYPEVSQGLEEGRLTIHAWWLGLETGDLYCYDARDNAWRKK